MKNQVREEFSDMRKEDNRYGEKFHKTQTVKDHNKKDKYVKKYQHMHPGDLDDNEEDDYDYDDGYQPVEK